MATTLTLAFLLLLQSHFARAQITAVKIQSIPAHTSSNLRTVTPAIPLSGVIYYPAGARPFPSASKSAVVMLHGCSGMWSDRNVNAVNSASHFALPNAPNLQTYIEKWGIKFAQTGIIALALDSFTPRKSLPQYTSADSAQFQNQCNGVVPYNGTVDSYTERVLDLLAAYDYLATLPEINPSKIALMGWSQGAQSAMVEAAATTTTGAARAPTLYRRVLCMYPGCGDKLGFGPESHTVEESFWRPSKDMHLHVGQGDDFYDDCLTRAEKANSLTGAAGPQVTFPTIYDSAFHSYDNTPQTQPPLPQPRIPSEAWPTTKCATVTGNECAMKSTDIDALAFLLAVL